MKKIALILLYLCLPLIVEAGVDELLEPCINGGVSATGNYPSQVQEDDMQYALEPCINGGVSASGNYASQGQEGFTRKQISLFQ